MRNLKRVLSLALALVMVLGMMVITTSAAAYTDAEEITYTEAVEVMSAIGVINGMGDGTFAPKGTLTREQAAKILAYVTLGADADDYLTGSAAPFDDVAATKWSAKYVAYCKNLGIIAGVGDNKFNPAGTLTTVQFAKMLLVAAGIDGTYTGAGWENNVKTAAKDAGLDVITIDNSEITREEACELALAAMKYAPNAAGWVAKKGDTELKTFTDVADAVVYVATLKGLDTANAADYTYAPVGASGYLLDEVYGVTYNDLTATDEFGRPGIRYSKAPSINLFYADEAVAKYVNSFDEDVVEAMEEANAAAFTDATVVYNGGTDTDVDAVDELYLGNGKAINGYTVELYNLDNNAKTIEKIIVIEAGLATVGEFVDATAVSDAYVTLSAVQMRGDNLTITVTDDDEKADLYDALAAAYAEDDVVSIVTKPGWHVDLTEDCILAVEPTTAVAGKITKVSAGSYNCTTTVVIDGTEYALNNMCKGGKALTAGTEGTLYLDAQGKGLGWANKSTQQAAKPIVYVVDYYKNVQTIPNELTGVPTTKTTYWALCVDTNGEIVTYQRAATTEKAVNKMCEVTLTYNATLKANVASFTPVNNTTTAETKATDIKINGNNYYTDDVKYIFVDGQMDELKVEVKEGVQAVASGTTKWYEAKAIQNDANNKTTSYVFVSAAVADPSVTVSGVVYAAESAASATQVLYTDAQGDEQTGYEHTVYVDGVETTVVTATADALSGFITLTEVVEGVYAAETKTGTNLLTGKAIDNMYKGMITINGVATLTDVDVTGVTVINVSGNNKVPTDATKLGTTETVDLVTTSDVKGIVTIYVTASTRS